MRVAMPTVNPTPRLSALPVRLPANLPELVPYKPVGASAACERLYDCIFERECVGRFWKTMSDGAAHFSFDLEVNGMRVAGLSEWESLAASMADAIAQVERALPTMRAVLERMKAETP